MNQETLEMWAEHIDKLQRRGLLLSVGSRSWGQDYSDNGPRFSVVGAMLHAIDPEGWCRRTRLEPDKPPSEGRVYVWESIVNGAPVRSDMNGPRYLLNDEMFSLIGVSDRLVQLLFRLGCEQRYEDIQTIFQGLTSELLADSTHIDALRLEYLGEKVC